MHLPVPEGVWEVGERVISLFQHMLQLFSDFNIDSNVGLYAVSSYG